MEEWIWDQKKEQFSRWSLMRDKAALQKQYSCFDNWLDTLELFSRYGKAFYVKVSRYGKACYVKLFFKLDITSFFLGIEQCIEYWYQEECLLCEYIHSRWQYSAPTLHIFSNKSIVKQPSCFYHGRVLILVNLLSRKPNRLWDFAIDNKHIILLIDVEELRVRNLDDNQMEIKLRLSSRSRSQRGSWWVGRNEHDHQIRQKVTKGQSEHH